MKNNKHQSASSEQPAGLLKMKRDKSRLLIGSWLIEDNVARVMFTIGLAGGEIIITALDVRNGEHYEISDIRWDGQDLGFTFKEPSSGYETYTVITPLSSKVFLQRLALQKQWHKIPDSEAAKIRDAAKKSRLRMECRKNVT
jgi:hypothetical protein